MYLSRLVLNPDDRRARGDLASLYEMHRALANVFPGKRAENEGRNEDRALLHGLLYRVEVPSETGPVVLAQSAAVPDWSRLPPGYALEVEGPKNVQLILHRGQRLHFRLVANPVRRVQVEGKKHPRRLPLVFDHHPEKDGYLDWLGRQAEAAGFAILDVADAPFRLDRKRRVTNDPAEIQAIERGERPGIAKQRIPHFGVRFDGVLRVTDPDRLVEAVRKGIGPAKAFGFGLLSLAPAR